MDKLGQVITCKNLILLPWLQPWVSWRLPSINITAHRKTTGFLGGAGAVERETKRHGSHPWVGKIPWRRQWKLIPVFLPGESHAQRSLAGYTRVTPRGTRLKRLSTGKLRAVYASSYLKSICHFSHFWRITTHTIFYKSQDIIFVTLQHLNWWFNKIQRSIYST